MAHTRDWSVLTESFLSLFIVLLWFSQNDIFFFFVAHRQTTRLQYLAILFSSVFLLFSKLNTKTV